MWLQFPRYPRLYHGFFGFVVKYGWERIGKALRQFYETSAKKHNIIASTLLKGDRPLDVVFLLDESGSVSSQSFARSLGFVKKLITAFPDEKLRGNDSTRFGLSTFSAKCRPRFTLSSYTSQSQYQDAITNIVQSRVRTHLGAALNQTLREQFTEQRGLENERREHRDKRRGFQTVLIIFTDGISHDEVKYSAQHLKNKNIVIYVIGMGNYNPTQLEQIASSPSYVYNFSTFIELEKFVVDLTAASCNQTQPISLDKTVKAIANKQKYQYFRYRVNKNLNLKINVVDLSGETVVYVSRCNPHPHKFGNDLSFTNPYQKNKTLIISFNPIDKRWTDEDNMKPIYVSVTANSNTALFTIEGNTCDPKNCTEGTNQVVPDWSWAYTQNTSGQSLNNNRNPVIFLMIIVSMLHFYC